MCSVRSADDLNNNVAIIIEERFKDTIVLVLDLLVILESIHNGHQVSMRSSN